MITIVVKGTDIGPSERLISAIKENKLEDKVKVITEEEFKKETDIIEDNINDKIESFIKVPEIKPLLNDFESKERKNKSEQEKWRRKFSNR